MKKVCSFFAVAVAIFGLTVSAAHADAEYYVIIQGSAAYEANINIRKSDSQPTSLTDCLQYGINGSVKDPSVGITLGPPAFGSDSKYAYATLCNRVNNDWFTILYRIDLDSCHAWICDTTYSYRETKAPTQMHYKIDSTTFLTSQLNVNFGEAPDVDCSGLAGCQ